MKIKTPVVVILLLYIMLLYTVSTSAFLGIYEPGDLVSFSVVCLDDNGKRDTGCSSPFAEIWGPAFENGNVNATLAEAGDGILPGVWRGNYTIGSGNVSGTWSIYVNLTNTNSTSGATVMQFQVVRSGRGINNISAQLNDIGRGVQNNMSALNLSVLRNTSAESDQISADTLTILDNQVIIKSSLELHNNTMKAGLAAINTSITAINGSITSNLSNDNTFFRGLLLMLNTSLLFNISNSAFSSTVSASDRVAIGRECAVQTYRQNATVDFNFNLTNNSFTLLTTYTNYTSLNILINETYKYNNLSMLNKTVRNTSNG